MTDDRQPDAPAVRGWAGGTDPATEGIGGLMLKRLRKFIAEWWDAFGQVPFPGTPAAHPWARETALPNPAAMAFLIDTAARELEELAAMYDCQAGRRAAGTCHSKVEAYNMGLHRGKAMAYQAAAERLRSIPGTSS